MEVFANFLIGLREGLEAALVVGILVAYLRRTGRQRALRSVWAGVVVAVGVSLLFGAVLTYGPRGLSFKAQELIGGILSIMAVGVVTWMVFWMAKTARFMKAELEGRLDVAVAMGSFSVFLLAALAVGREGLETALFLWAAAQATGSSTQPLVGAIFGLALAVVIGWAITQTAVRFSLATFFRRSGVLLVVIAAGVFSYGIHDLQEAGVLPGLNNIAFDVSSTIKPGSWLATLLKGTVNFSPVTTKLEVFVWLVYIVPTMVLFLKKSKAPARKPSQTQRRTVEA